MRAKLDSLGQAAKIIAWAVDGSFCNQTIFKAELDRAIVIARTRKDAKLCWPANEKHRRYSTEKFTPQQILKNADPWQETLIFHGGKWRKVYYKQVCNILWQSGAGEKKLRLLVLKATPYRKTKKAKLLYRQPALVTDNEIPAQQLLQIYFDRWQLEVAHKELKSNFGLGQAQVRVHASVARQPALTVATYSIFHCAALRAFGPHPPDHFPLPKYQRDKSRLSCLDLVRFFRSEILLNPDSLPCDFQISVKSLLDSATI